MTRSIGDRNAKTVGVIATPIVTQIHINDNSISCLIMASDGVWDVMSNQEVVEFISEFGRDCVTDNEGFGLGI